MIREQLKPFLLQLVVGNFYEITALTVLPTIINSSTYSGASSIHLAFHPPINTVSLFIPHMYLAMIYLHVSLSLSILPSIHPPIYLHVSPYLSIYLSSIFPSVVSIYRPIYSSMYLSFSST